MDPSNHAPPAPPLPQNANTSPLHTQKSETLPGFLLKIQSMPKDYLTRPLEEGEKAKPEVWQKSMYFFYGTLKEPKTLSHILDKPVLQSALHAAYVIGYSIQMWGQYKALVIGSQGDIVEGVAYEVQSEEDEEKLANYETSAYEVAPCNIYLRAKGEGIEPERICGNTFIYAGDAQALREGRWDRKLWLKNMQSRELSNPRDQELRDVAARLTASHQSKKVTS